MKKKCFNISFYILFGLLFIILIYSITLIYKYYHDKSETKKIETKIKLIEKNNQSDNSIKEDVLTSEDLKQLSNKKNVLIYYMIFECIFSSLFKVISESQLLCKIFSEKLNSF